MQESKIFPFLRRLAANNNREWFHANKPEYDEVRREMYLLARRLINLVAEFDPRAAGLRVEDCTYRIYRDTRFSVDKTPYKTHIGIFINPPLGKKGMTLGYYFHLEPDKSFFAAGTIGLPAPVLKAVRQSIYDEIDEFRSIVEDPKFRRFSSEIGFNKLKTAPKGFPKDWEFIDYLRPRDYCTETPVPDSIFGSDDMGNRFRPMLAQGKRFNDFINFTVEEFLEGNISEL